MTETSTIDERMVGTAVQPQQSPKPFRMNHKCYRLYRTGHIASFFCESGTKKFKCDETAGRGPVGIRTLKGGANLSVWIWLVLCPVALENEPIVRALFKQEVVRQEDTRG